MHKKVHGVIDPESMYATDRRVTLEFLENVSEQKQPDGAVRKFRPRATRIGVEESQSC